ncbi:hypothetical protein BU17DRAFT_62580 [Hysterangium stoloniferum]|nr:hypothetical protein BU17DRAFT_62580 [Hysterangium stoloniferum]
MSAYGPNPNPPRNSQSIIPSSVHPLGQTTYAAGAGARGALSIHHLTAATIPHALAGHLYAAFQAELDRGVTYPQEHPMARPGFDAYFLGGDCFVGIVHAAEDGAPAAGVSLEAAAQGRAWEHAVGGVYYVKPNYPGRSSHICNAGFLVAPAFRGIGVASALARSYVHNAPRLGYRASIFNLVYVNNVTSVRIWERLGFTKIGRIPQAGRLKRSEADGGGEEYVDAWIIYKSFEDQDLT